MAKGSLFSIASLAVNQMIVIDNNGDIKIATIGEKLPEGSVIIQRGDEAGFNNQATTHLVGQNDELQNVTDDVAQLLAALEEGQDPTQLDDELAPAAGGSNGSAPTDSASIDRVGSEIIASTNFSTTGFESLGFSQTQSLALINLTRSNASVNGESDASNSDPVAEDDAISIDEDSLAVTIDVLANDTDSDGDSLTIISASVSEEEGTVSIVDGKLIFTPAENYNGQANIEYTVSDGQGGFDTATVTVTVNSVNDAPTTRPVDLGTVEEEGSITITTAQLLANADDIEGDNLTISELTASSGSLSYNSDNGTWTYTPEDDDDTAVTFSYTITDDGTTNGSNDFQSVQGSATLDITPVNDAPTTRPVDLGTVEEEGSITITTAQLLANADDIEGDDLSISELTASSGSLSYNSDNGTWTYTPEDDDDTAVTFSYTITDDGTTNGSNDFQSVQGSATLDITPVNDAPTTRPVDLGTVEEEGSITITTAQLLANADDIEGDNLTISELTASSGSLSYNSDNGTWTYTPEDDDDTAVTFSYTITDDGTTNGSNDFQSVQGSATLDITPVNDAPTTRPVDLGTVEEDGSITITTAQLLKNADDIEGDDLSISELTASSGSLSYNNDGTWTYKPAEHDDTEVTFSYTITDNGTTNGESNPLSVSGSATLDITPVNDAPIINVDNEGYADTASITEDGVIVNGEVSTTTLSGSVSATDVDDTNLSWSSTGVASLSVNDAATLAENYVSAADLGAFTLNANGNWTFDLTPEKAQFLNNGESLTLTYPVSVSDGNKSDVEAVTIIITGTNDDPIARDDTNAVPSLIETVIFTESFEDMGSASATSIYPDGWTVINHDPTEVWDFGNEGLEIQADDALQDVSPTQGDYYAELDPNDNTTISTQLSTSDQDSLRVEFDYYSRVADNAQGDDSSDISFTIGNLTVSIDSQGNVIPADADVSVEKTSNGWYHIIANTSVSDTETTLSFSGAGNSDSVGGLIDNIVVTGISVPSEIDSDSYDVSTGTLFGNVLDNDSDIDNESSDLTVTEITYGDQTVSVDEENGATIFTSSGTLHISSDGSYTFDVATSEVNISDLVSGAPSNAQNNIGIEIYGLTSGSYTHDINGKEYVISSTKELQANVSSNGSGAGIKDSDNKGDDSKIDSGESLIIHLDSGANNVTVGLSNAKDSEVAINVFDVNGERIADSDYSYQFSYIGNGNSNSHGVSSITITSSAVEIGYIVFGVNGHNKSYRLDGNIDIRYESTADSDFKEQFTYTVEDGDGGSDTATLTIGDGLTVNDAPVVTFESGQDHVVVSEEGLAGVGNPDNNGASDTTDDVIATGSFSVNDVDTNTDDLTVSLVAPETILYSNGIVIQWSTEDGNLVGKAGDETILEISLNQDSSDPSSYDYTVTLLGSVDHADTTQEDTLSFEVGISVSDGVNTTKESITITVEDDSPVATQNVVVNAVDITDTVTTELGSYVFTHRPHEPHCGDNNSFTFSDTTSGASILVYALGFSNLDRFSKFSELTFDANYGLGVKSDFGLDRKDGEIDYRYEYARSEQIVMKLEEGTANSVTLNLTQFYSGESSGRGEHGKITFYWNGSPVDSETFSANSTNGEFVGKFSSDKLFDEIRLEATDNDNRDSWNHDNSDFAVKSVSFSSSVSNPIIATDEGTIDADFGADGAGEITLTGIADTDIETASGLDISLGSDTVVDGIQTQIWVDSNGNKVFELELNTSTGEWSYKQYAELETGKAVEITYDVMDADGDSVSSIPAEPELVAGLQGEFYNVDSQLWKIEHAIDVINSQKANAHFIATDIHYYSSHRDDLGGLNGDNNSHLQSWLGDDGSSVAFNDRKYSNDSVIRLSGGVQIAAGSYTMKVIADDGYQIKLDGEIVASFDRNTSKLEKEFSFDVCGSGVHALEIIYWDQGGHYVLDVSIGDSNGQNFQTLGSEAYPTYLPESADFVDMSENLTAIIEEYTSHADGLVYDQTIHGTSNDDPKQGDSGNDHISTGNSQDRLYGKAGDDWLEAGDGDDYLEGNCGDDVLDGGTGQDKLYGGAGNDWLIGGDGDDKDLYGEACNDLIDGGQGQDNLYGGVGNDILIGGTGDDYLFGGDGNDVLIGGSNHDTLVGGAGHDLFVLEGSDSSDTIVDFNVDEDAIDISDLLTISSTSDPDEIQAYLDSDSSSFSIKANSDGSATISVEDQNHAWATAGSFGEGSQIASGDIVSVLFNNQEYKVTVD